MCSGETQRMLANNLGAASCFAVSVLHLALQSQSLHRQGLVIAFPGCILPVHRTKDLFHKPFDRCSLFA